jgi:hypothetical protein
VSKVWTSNRSVASVRYSRTSFRASNSVAVDQVVIYTSDKDLGQCIVGTRVVQLDRRRGGVRDEAGVVEKFGVVPESIPEPW